MTLSYAATEATKRDGEQAPHDPEIQLVTYIARAGQHREVRPEAGIRRKGLGPRVASAQSRMVRRVTLPAQFGDEYQLLWPRPLFAAEAAAITKLDVGRREAAECFVSEVFSGQQPLEDLHDAQRRSPATGWLDDLGDDGSSQFLRHLVEHVEDLPDQMRPYWSARHSLPPVPWHETDQPQVQDRWRDLVHRLDDRGYFDRVTPSECVDGPTASERRQILVLEILRRTGISASWPVQAPPLGWDADEFYTLVEVVHDFASRPRTRSFHDFGQDWHYGDFSIETGQALYRFETNQILLDGETDLQLANSGPEAGRLVHQPRDGRAGLIASALARAGSNLDDPVHHAITLFQSRSAQRTDKRLACIGLAGVLEERRKLVKKNLLTKDEAALFQIANQFGIRHQNANQHPDYAEDYLDWIFWAYLATIELTDRLAER